MNNYQEPELKSTKICTKCNCEKSFIEFNEYKTGKYGIQSECKSCNKEYRKINRDKRKKYEFDNNINQYQKEYQKEYRLKNKIKRLEYLKNNKNKITKKQNEYVKTRRLHDLSFKILLITRSRLRAALKSQNVIKYKKTLDLLGCSKEEYIKHIESQFKDGMTWDNHGVFTWHIDHIKPMAAFDLNDPEQLKECCHYTNMQPLWAFDNLSKGDKI